MKRFRSYLYVPANQRGRVEKAYNGNADAIVLDLEDAVPLALKDQARADVVDILSNPLPKTTFVRVNGPGTPWCKEDVAAVAGTQVKAIRLPKVDRSEDIRAVSSWLDDFGCRAEIQLIIESAYGVENAFRLASVSSRISMIGLGETDLRADLRAGAGEEALEHSRSRCVLASRAAGLMSPVASVFPEVRDLDGLRDSSHRVKAMGFFGRFAIHPAQVDVINDVFSPSPVEIDKARALVNAMDRSVSDGVSVAMTEDGHLVAPPVVANARLTLELAEALEQEREVA